MSVQYTKLGNGQWMVEAWAWVSDTEVMHTTCVNVSRWAASWDAVSSVAKRIGVL